MSIDDKISNSWQKSKTLHDNKLPINVPMKLQELLQTQTNKEELEQELKELAMEWFWHGYYKGFNPK